MLNEYQCDLIKSSENSSTKAELQTNYDINSRSCLCFLPDFDVTKQLPHDIMHVLLEGIVLYELQLSLTALIAQRHFTLEEFNYKLKQYQFSYVDNKSKPEPLNKTVFVTGERELK